MRLLHVGHGFRPFHHGGLINYAEGLMDVQAARGDEVHYFFSGRHYPLLRPRVRSWTRGAVRMHELLNSPVLIPTADLGTQRPDLDLDEETVERLFRDLLGALRPDLVHVHEIGGLPSSLLEIPAEGGVPVVMDLRDYFPLCPTVKLFDVDGEVCLRLDPAHQCVRCCRDAPVDNRERVRLTLHYHKVRAAARFPVLARVPSPWTLARRVRGPRAAAGNPPTRTPGDDDVRGFRRRREVNVARLSRVDRLLALSPRVAEIYSALGVDRSRLRVVTVAPAHLEAIRPRRLEPHGGPLRFVTLNGCSSIAKGAEVVAGAVEELTAMGLTEQDLTLSVAGNVHPSVAGRLAAVPMVRHLGSYSHDDLDAILDPFDVGIVPSVWEETYGFVGVEMLAKGLPVVANAIGGLVEYTAEGETGWLNRDLSPSGLARIMAAIVAEPKQVVAVNRRIVARRAQLVRPTSQHLDELRALYSELIAHSSSTDRPVG